MTTRQRLEVHASIYACLANFDLVHAVTEHDHQVLCRHNAINADDFFLEDTLCINLVAFQQIEDEFRQPSPATSSFFRGEFSKRFILLQWNRVKRVLTWTFFRQYISN